MFGCGRLTTGRIGPFYRAAGVLLFVFLMASGCAPKKPVYIPEEWRLPPPSMGTIPKAEVRGKEVEAEMGTMTLVSIPTWILEAVLPLTFGLMAFRFALRAIQALSVSVELVKTRERRRQE